MFLVLRDRPTESSSPGVLEERVHVRRQVQTLTVFGGGQRGRVVGRDQGTRNVIALDDPVELATFASREEPRVHRLGTDDRDASQFAGEDALGRVVDELLGRIAADTQETRRDIHSESFGDQPCRVVGVPREGRHRDDLVNVLEHGRSTGVDGRAFEGVDHQVPRLFSRRVGRVRTWSFGDLSDSDEHGR